MGNVYVVDLLNYSVKKFGPNGNYLLSIGTTVQFTSPQGVAVDSKGNIYVTDWSGARQNVQEFGPDGTYIAAFVSGHPWGIAIDAVGNVYVSDFNNNNVTKYSPAGVALLTIGSGQLSSPTYVALDSAGNVYVVDLGNNRVAKFDPTGAYLSRIGVVNSRGVALDAVGDIFVASTSTVVEYNASGTLLATFSLSGVQAIAIQ